MATDNESFNRDLYDLLKVRGYNPVPLNAQNQRVKASQEADVIQFEFTKDGESYGTAWVTVDDAQNIIVYYDNEQQDSPSTSTPGVDYDDSWTGFLKHLKNWAQRRQMSFELANKDRLGDDMRQRDYYKMKERLGESKQVNELSPAAIQNYSKHARRDLDKHDTASDLYHDLSTMASDNTERDQYWQKGQDAAKQASKRFKGLQMAKKKLEKVDESYHAMGKKASYNDAVPNVKIVLQHNRSLEEGEARFRNVARIYLENVDGERFLAPTTRPGIARVYARHIAEGGLPNDEKWNHIKSICEDYNKMAGFVRATKNGQFNESAQALVEEGVDHYNKLRESLHKLSTHRGYHNYFESWSPPLMEDELDESINELFVQEMVDPRIESAMPILSRLQKPVTEMAEVDSLAEWADGIINEKLEEGDVVQGPWKKHDDEEDWDDDSWIPSVEDFEQEEKIRNRKRGPANDINEMGGDQHYSDTKGAWDLNVGKAKPVKVKDFAKSALKSLNRVMKGWEKGVHDVDTVKAATKSLSPDQKEKALGAKVGKGSPAELQQKLIKREKNKPVDETFIGMSPQAVAEEQLDELDSKTLQSYADKSFKAGARAGWAKNRADNPEDFKKASNTADKRVKGLGMATKKLISKMPKDDLEEDLGPEQKRVGQLGPTEKVKNNNIGKLVGASESTEIDPELARIIEMSGLKRPKN